MSFEKFLKEEFPNHNFSNSQIEDIKKAFKAGFDCAEDIFNESDWIMGYDYYFRNM